MCWRMATGRSSTPCGRGRPSGAARNLRSSSSMTGLRASFSAPFYGRLLCKRFRYCRVDQGAQVSAQSQAGRAADYLGHEHDGELFLGVDPERGRGGATPEIFAKRSWEAGLGDIYIDPAAD